ncbi:ankyrin repeat domain-containing protein [Mesorhizobium muleiense]|uniref:ankyrin repeat domain-containing protein n=1 Tax=Mesorhizobium muleiense TaxID=1004279 RepID=UPI003AFA837D
MRGVLLFILLVLAPIASHAAAIHDAAKTGDVAAIAAALDAGADVDESDGQATPLYLAVRGGHFAAAKLLIERGADVNAARRRVWVLPSCRLWQNAGSI